MILNETTQEPGSSEPGFGPWLIAGTPSTEPYPCLCHTRKYGRCSPIYCPCAGRIDYENVPPECCARRHTPDVVTQAKAINDLKRRREAMS